MSVEIMLMEEIAGLGKEGDIVKVADGYARNYLLPRNLAAPVTDAARRRLVKLKKEREAKAKAELERAQELANRLASISCTLVAKVGEDEKLYGSVTASDVIDQLVAQGIKDIEKKHIKLEHPIKELGVYNIGIKLHPDVETFVKVWVVEE